MAGVKIGQITYLKASSQVDPALEAAIAKAVQAAAGETIRYLYAPVQLHGSRPQWLVLLVSEQFVGSGGATALILNEDRRLVTRFTLVNNPVLVCPQATKGWKDLIFFVAGGGVKGHYARLRFNGSGYPSNPSSPAAVPAATVLSGTAVLADDLNPESGLKFTVK